MIVDFQSYFSFGYKNVKIFENLKTFSGATTIYTCKGKSLQVDLKEEGGWLL